MLVEPVMCVYISVYIDYYHFSVEIILKLQSLNFQHHPTVANLLVLKSLLEPRMTLVTPGNTLMLTTNVRLF